MAGTASSGPTDEPLHFIIRHIFLPPCPNTRGITNSTANEGELMQTVHDALTLFRDVLDAAQSQVLGRCIRMLKCMMDARTHIPPDTDVLEQQMAVLGDNGTFTPSSAQNADRHPGTQQSVLC